MSLKSEQVEKPFAAFPNGNNLRITVAGLAVCRFTENTTQPSHIHFLNHVDEHELRVTVRRKAISSTQYETVLAETPVPVNPRRPNDISVAGTFVHPQASYIHTPQTGEFPLLTLLHLSNLHRTRFNRNPKETTDLNLSNCSFYMKELTDDPYVILVEGTRLEPPEQIGKILAGYMRLRGNDGDTVFIDVNRQRFFESPIVESGNTYEYEIEFTNHCEAIDPEVCKAVIGNLGSDVRFLYDILTPSKSAFRKIMLFKISFDADDRMIFTPDVAACLPGTTEP